MALMEGSGSKLGFTRTRVDCGIVGSPAWSLAEPAGMVMPWKKWAICFYDHPKAIDLGSGKIVRSWPEINSGRQVNVIEIGNPEPPSIALDPQHGRFAVADSKGVTIVSLAVG